MNNTELKKNAEHYDDPTPACSLAKPETGDVYDCGGTLSLILKNHGPFSTVLILTDNDFPRNIKLQTSRGTKWTDPRLTTYRWHDKIGKYEETLSAESIALVTAAMEEALGVNPRPTSKEYMTGLERLTTQIEEYHEELEALKATLDNEKRARAAAEFEAVRAKNQLDLLRGMYDDLLSRALGEA